MYQFQDKAPNSISVNSADIPWNLEQKICYKSNSYAIIFTRNELNKNHWANAHILWASTEHYEVNTRYWHIVFVVNVFW